MEPPQTKTKRQTWLKTFASLVWYEETIRFIFNFITKTSELLLTAGIVGSTANFLTDGEVMRHNMVLATAWSWAQAVAIDSSLGVTCMNALQALRERERLKAVIFSVLTLLLATVAGLITHFDALAHATGLPVTDQGVSGIIPLWVMTALRAVAVIGFLLASRIKEVSFTALGTALAQPEPHIPAPESDQNRSHVPPVPSLDYQTLVTAMLSAMQQADMLPRVRVNEEPTTFTPKVLPAPAQQGSDAEQEMHMERSETSESPGNPNGPILVSPPPSLRSEEDQPLAPPESEVRDQNPHLVPGAPHPDEHNDGNRDHMQLEADETILHETRCSREDDPNEDQTAMVSSFMTGERYLRERLLPAIGSSPPGLFSSQPEPGENPLAPSRSAPPTETISANPDLAAYAPETQEWEPQVPNSDHQGRSSESVDERLRHAYLALQREGARITGESLRRRASIRTQTARAWLREEKARLRSSSSF